MPPIIALFVAEIERTHRPRLYELHAVRGPILADYRDEGVVRPDIDIDRAARWHG